MALKRSKADLSRHYNAPAKTINEWTNRTDCPGGRSGPWETDLLDAWLDERGSDYGSGHREQGHEERGGTGKAHWDEQNSKQTALLKRDKRRVNRGQLMYRDDVERDVAMAFVIVQARVMAAPGEMSMRLPPDIRDEITAEYEDKFRLALTEAASMKLTDESTIEDAIIACADAITQKRAASN